MINDSTYIGEVVSVSGSSVSIKLADIYPSNMPIVDGRVYRVGQIGSFLKIPLGYANLYGIVVEAGVTAIPDALLKGDAKEIETLQPNRWLKLSLVGEQVGVTFERGVLQSPASGDGVHLVTNADLQVIYGGYKAESTIVVGNQSASEALDARLDFNKLVSRHCAILGSTGSGKSNAVSVLLRAIAEKGLPSSRILVIDPHGEYSSALKGICRVFRINSKRDQNEEELVVPYWALPFRELISLFPGRLSDQNEDYIRSKVVEHKVATATRRFPDIKKEVVTADTPLPFSIKNLWFQLDEFERTTYTADRITPERPISQGNADLLESRIFPPPAIGNAAPFSNNKAKGILGFLDGFRSRLLDRRFSFLFEPGVFTSNVAGDTNSDLHALYTSWFNSGVPVTILDLSGIPAEIVQVLSGCILKLVFDALYWGQFKGVGGREQPLLMVLDEAHAYLKAGENSISSRTVQAIAKEGRKYGVGLLLVTQRPSELDETVLSQCGSLIALRMTNQKDRAHVGSAMQDELRQLMDTLPSLRTGEAVISGEIVRIPSRIRFFQAPFASIGSTPIASKQWAQAYPAPDLYVEAVKNWRHQSFY